MKIENLDHPLRCIRPMLWLTPIPEVPLFRWGTGFFLRWRGCLWIITARHCIDDGTTKYWQDYTLHVPVALDAPSSLVPVQVSDLIVPLPAAGPQQPWALDLAAFRCAQADLGVVCVDLDSLAVADFASARAGDVVRVFGLPYALETRVLYETREVHVETFLADCDYDKEISPTVHRFDFPELRRARHPNGMSGGPVFHVRKESASFAFAGVLVGATESGGTGIFVDWRAVFAMLEPHSLD